MNSYVFLSFHYNAYLPAERILHF